MASCQSNRCYEGIQMRILFSFLIISLLWMVSSHRDVVRAMDSQILVARDADLIVVGKAVWLADSPFKNPSSPWEIRPTNIPSVYQTVVFQIAELIKGKNDGKYLKVCVRYSVELLAQPSLELKEGRNYILLLQTRHAQPVCSSDIPREYGELDDIEASSDAVIVSTPDEVRAIHWLIEDCP